MPFTPKFVDMVRNLTTSTGTGAVNPGSAVSGFTSLSAAVATGEQFYYCIQGVDKPAEREVGRGTMQSNGTVAREAISGGLTNFTTGTKTIALVAAAEWFAKVEQGGSGSASLIVPGLTELAALPTANGAGAMLTAKGREGLFVFDASNLSSKVTADTRKGIYVAPTAAPSGASGAWVRKFDGPVQLGWFGAAADFVTDDLAAFNAAHDLIRAQTINFSGGATLAIGPGRYYLSDTWNIHFPLNIVGAGGASAGTLLRFGKNKTGIVFNYANTHGEGAGSQGNAEGSSMEGVQLWGGNVNVNGAGSPTSFAAGDSPIGNGVRIRCTFVRLSDVSIACFGGDGFNINASNGSGPGTTGNANNFQLRGCDVRYCGGYGYVVSGTDANAGTIDTCSAISCGGGGFIEYSFLGNTYIQCHARDNGKVDPVACGKPVGVCSYGGNYYYAKANKLAEASTVVPGTDVTVWGPYYGGGGGRTWVSGLTWVNPSPYGTNPANVNGRNVFLGCYAESAQAPCQATYPSMFLGGLLDEVTVVGSATWMRGTGNGGISCGELSVSGPGGTTRFGNPDGQIIYEHQHTSGITKTYRRDDFFGGKIIETQLDNSLVASALALDNNGPLEVGAMALARLWVGGSNGVNGARRLRGIGSLAELNGLALGVGDLFINFVVTVGTPGLYICTTAGTYGSGAVVTPLAPAGLAEAANADLWSGTSQSKFVSPKRLFDAAAEVALTDGASIALDLATGISFAVTLAGNRALANPANAKPGQSGMIFVTQDGTGSRTLTYGGKYKFPGGAPALSTPAGSIDAIAYQVRNNGDLACTLLKAFA